MNNNHTHIAILLDRSGSMQSIKNDIIGGFNSFIEEQKKVPGELTVTLVQFDENEDKLQYEVICDFQKLSEVKPLTSDVYRPRGSTPLNDSFAKLINETGAHLSRMEEGKRPGKVLLVSITDGYENASKEQTKDSIKTLTEHQKSKYNWEFVYIGANQDSFAEGSTRGYTGTLNFMASSAGTKEMYAKLSSTTASYRSTGDLGDLKVKKEKDLLKQDKEEDQNVKTPDSN